MEISFKFVLNKKKVYKQSSYIQNRKIVNTFAYVYYNYEYCFPEWFISIHTVYISQILMISWRIAVRSNHVDITLTTRIINFTMA